MITNSIQLGLGALGNIMEQSYHIIYLLLYYFQLWHKFFFQVRSFFSNFSLFSSISHIIFWLWCIHVVKVMKALIMEIHLAFGALIYRFPVRSTKFIAHPTVMSALLAL